MSSQQACPRCGSAFPLGFVGANTASCPTCHGVFERRIQWTGKKWRFVREMTTFEMTGSDVTDLRLS